MTTIDLQPEFDPSALAGIEQSLPHAEFQAFVTGYLADAAERLTCAEAICAAGNLAELGAEAHTMISVTGSYGLRRASWWARQLAESCRKGRTEAALAHFAELAASSREGWVALRERFIAP